MTGVTHSAYSFIPACFEDHARRKMLQKEWNLFYEMSLSHGLFDGYKENKLIASNTGS